MKWFQFELKDDNGNWVANLFVDIRKEMDATINFRYGQFFDDTLKINSDEGHYRCEIENGVVTYEILPKTSRHLGILLKIMKTLEKENPDLYIFIKAAYSKGDTKAIRF
jgi:hypothetical protein